MDPFPRNSTSLSLSNRLGNISEIYWPASTIVFKPSNLFIVHEKANVVHRDIKPDNLLIDENDRIKISDFGVSFIMENGSDEIATTAGSNYFFAPEVCNGTKFKGRKSDIWAAGVTLYQIVFKKLPFVANNIPDLYHQITTQE